MFGLIRRISLSVIPRPDRPWEDDPTSNAPHKPKKRRLSSTERGDDPDGEQSNKKKVRGDSVSSETNDDVAQERLPTTPPQPETQEVKEVTKGVKKVELEDKKPAPESVPLPDADPQELDDLAPVADAEGETESKEQIDGDVLNEGEREGEALNPTSPMKRPEAVETAVEGCDAAVSKSSSSQSIPTASVDKPNSSEAATAEPTTDKE